METTVLPTDQTLPAKRPPKSYINEAIANDPIIKQLLEKEERSKQEYVARLWPRWLAREQKRIAKKREWMECSIRPRKREIARIYQLIARLRQNIAGINDEIKNLKNAQRKMKPRRLEPRAMRPELMEKLAERRCWVREQASMRWLKNRKIDMPA